MSDLKADNISRGWLALAGLLIIIEFASLYQARVADVSGYERVFAVFAGLSVLCFAALLYAVAEVFYGWD